MPADHPNPAEGRDEGGLEIWVCRGCMRIGTSERDLITQGCEGSPEQVVPLTQAIAERDKLVEALAGLNAAISAFPLPDKHLAEYEGVAERVTRIRAAQDRGAVLSAEEDSHEQCQRPTDELARRIAALRAALDSITD